jgi:pyruvate dehydrogenase phosphatase
MVVEVVQRSTRFCICTCDRVEERPKRDKVTLTTVTVPSSLLLPLRISLSRRCASLPFGNLAPVSKVRTTLRREMLRHAWKPLAAAAVAGPPIYWWYHRSAPAPETFDVAVREMGPDGQSRKIVRTLPLLPKAAVDARIREHATLDTRPLADGRTWRISTAYVASNDPIEDRHAYAVVRKSALLPDERLFVAVMDGHSGFHTSQFLSHALIPAVAAELAEAARPAKPAQSVAQRVSSLFGSSAVDDSAAATQLSPVECSRAIQDAFAKLDYEIITAPLKLFAAAVNKSGLQKKVIPDLSENKLAVAALQPATSGASFLNARRRCSYTQPCKGSCAIMAVLDPIAQDMYVACTGDARAVAGYWEEDEDGKGRWRVEVLSEDQTGRNPNELQRCVYLFSYISVVD